MGSGDGVGEVGVPVDCGVLIPGGSLDKDCTQPTGEERTELAQWIACERLRPHDFIDAGVDAAN